MFICMNLGLRQTDPLHLCLDRVDVNQRQLACSARNGSEILWHTATNTVHLTVMCLIRRSECSLFLVALLCLKTCSEESVVLLSCKTGTQREGEIARALVANSLRSASCK